MRINNTIMPVKKAEWYLLHGKNLIIFITIISFVVAIKELEIWAKTAI